MDAFCQPGARLSSSKRLIWRCNSGVHGEYVTVSKALPYMHVHEGVLIAPVLAGGALLAAGGVALGLRAMNQDNIVKVAVTSSAFFVASLIQIPVGVSSVHLVLNGLCGLLLGWAAFPAVAVGLVLQVLLFGIGGLTTLGVNTVIMALPGVLCHYLFRRIARSGAGAQVFYAGFGAGVLGIVIGATLLAAVLLRTGDGFTTIAGAVFLAHFPVMAVEGFVTGFALVFLHKVRPETLAAPVAAHPADSTAG
jgi:cobalt/nickel transport system permease protein